MRVSGTGIFMTARPESYRAKTETALRAVGLEPHALVMDYRHSRRFLINDHASSNPYPSAVAVSVERNSASLAGTRGCPIKSGLPAAYR